MGFHDRIDAVKGEIDSLIAYANEKTGESDTSIGDAILTLCDGYGSGGGSSERDAVMLMAKMIGYDMGDESEWSLGSFTLPSDVSTGYITVDNPLGSVPTDFIVFPKSIFSVDDCSKYCYGGYNFGNTMDDKDYNRTIQALLETNGSTSNQTNRSYTKTLYNLVNNSCPSVATASKIYFRTGNICANKWKSGDYFILAR